MRTIAIVGAGPGLGFSIAKRFGAEGFDVALIARDRDKLDSLVDGLGDRGVTAAGFTADITSPAVLTSALRAAEERFGSVDVLEFSPAPAGAAAASLAPVAASKLTVDSVRPQIEYYLYGGITAIQAVLPAMLARGSGTLLVTTGASSGPVVHPPFGNIAAASGALRNWVLNLNVELAPTGVYAAHVAIAAWISSGGPAANPDTIAETHWELHTDRSEAERLYLDPASST